jgi:predicted RNA-binding Zn-ribbon protein involved in translation (DUF1610 family)
MNITNVKAGNFANGFSHFCPNCGRFFSVQFMDGEDEIGYCPNCGEEFLLTTIDGLLDHCATHHTDPVNFYHAFSPNEPIPQSRTGATPKQVEWIVGCVTSDKQKKLTVTAESLAAQLGYNKEIVTKVFEELHITENGAVTT